MLQGICSKKEEEEEEEEEKKKEKKKKKKAIPLQAWTGPEDSRRMRLPDFKTIGTWKW